MRISVLPADHGYSAYAYKYQVAFNNMTFGDLNAKGMYVVTADEEEGLISYYSGCGKGLSFLESNTSGEPILTTEYGKVSIYEMNQPKVPVSNSTNIGIY